MENIATTVAPKRLNLKFKSKKFPPINIFTNRKRQTRNLQMHLPGDYGYQMGNGEYALDMNSMLLKDKSDLSQKYNNLAIVLNDAGKLDEAAEYYQIALEINPSQPEVYNNLGLIRNAQGAAEEAVQCYRRALKFSQHPVIYFNLGIALHEQGKLAEAITCYQRAIEINPKQPEVYNNLGNAFFHQDKLVEAVRCFQKAIQLDPGAIDAHYNLGNTYKEMGQLEDASACYERALDIDPGAADVHNTLGLVFFYLNHWDKAITCFQKAIQLDPENYSAKHLLAALTGQLTKTAPRKYVVDLFNHYAKKYDNHLVEELEFRVPKLLLESVNGVVGEKKVFERAMDLGCGTGLSGVTFNKICRNLDGIDLSSKMLAKAREKRIYDDLQIGDIVELLDKSEKKYDLFIASDVFIYVGELNPIFEAIRNHAKEGAYFVFSTETAKSSEYVLRPTGRYAHNYAYIQKVAQRHHFSMQAFQTTGIRKEKQRWIEGNLFVFQYRH